MPTTASAGASGQVGSTNNGGVDADKVGPKGGYTPLTTSSWDTELTLEVMAQSPGSGPLKFNCKSTHLVMHVEPKDGALELISGAAAGATRGQLARSSDSIPSYELHDPFAFPLGDCTTSAITLTALTLRARDADGVGGADHIEGEGRGTATIATYDVLSTVVVSFHLFGVPDIQKPTLSTPSGTHPLDEVLIRASEPLSLSSSVTLSNSTGKVPLTASLATSGAFSSFDSDVVLPFGSSWDVQATGEDLGGLLFDPEQLPKFTVESDPGLFAQDGFESAPQAGLSGAARIVTAVGDLPAIAGSKSLLVSRDGSASLHLARPASGSSLRFTTRMLTETMNEHEGTPPIEIGVVGGTARLSPGAPASGGAPSPTGDSVWAYAYPARDISLSLPEVGSDIVVRIRVASGCLPLCFRPQAVLIDELRVE